MNIKIIEQNFDKEIFNKKAIHPMQAWQWGEAREEMGIKVIRIGEFDDNKLQEVYQMTLHPVPHTNWKIGYLPRSKAPSETVLEFLKDYGKKHKIIFIKIEPYIKRNTLPLTNNDLRISPHPLFPQWTMMLDLKKSEEELLKEMKSKTRYNIRLAQKKGVVVKEESNEKGFDKFIKLYFETCKRQHYFGHTPEYHKIIWKSLKDHIAHILIAYYNDTPLAAYELFYFHKKLYYPYGGSSDVDRNVMAPNLIMWEAVRLGKRLEAETFDMWGSLAPNYDPHDPWAGFTRFKEGYNAHFVQMSDSYDLVINSPLYSFYNIGYKLRHLFLKLR